VHIPVFFAFDLVDKLLLKGSTIINSSTVGDTMSYTSHKLHLSSTIVDEILVRDVMTTDILSVEKFESIITAAHMLAGRNISGLPVLDKEKRVIGIVTQADILAMVGVRKEHTFKDLLKHALGEPLSERKSGDIVADIMTAPASTTHPDTKISEIAQLMDEQKIRRLPVVDDQNKLVGIISRADILKAVLRKLG
jgi:CBS domain-containing protein